MASAGERGRLARNRRAVGEIDGGGATEGRVRRFVKKMRRGYLFWFTFVAVSGVEPTNNRAERSLGELFQKKIIRTLRNEKGIFTYETLPTLLAT